MAASPCRAGASSSKGIEATATSSQGRSLAIDATGRAGDGVLTLAGTTELDADAGWPTQLTLRGDTVRIVQLPDVEIFASPDLRVDVALPVIEVTGSVHVPRASARARRAALASRDAVAGRRRSWREARDTRSRPLQLRTAIEFTLGDDVRYSGLNLDTTVTGELRVATEPNAPRTRRARCGSTAPTTRMAKSSSSTRGQLLFSGPLDDPGLDVRAVRPLETTDFRSNVTEVGVELTGTLKAPRTRVFSTPAMSEADALSYLLFGRPVSGSDAGMGTEETSALQTAALSLGLQQALPVVQRIGNTLGLDELTVQSTDTDAGALMAGKYLSPQGLHPLQLRSLQPHRRLSAALSSQRPLEHRDALRRAGVDGSLLHGREGVAPPVLRQRGSAMLAPASLNSRVHHTRGIP